MVNKSIIGIVIGTAALGAAVCIYKQIKSVLHKKRDLTEMVEVFEEDYRDDYGEES